LKRLIVNADDFGLTGGVNRAVIVAHETGIVTSTTIMVNMPGFEEAACLAAEHPSLAVGLHFNITQGEPVSRARNVRSLLNVSDSFPGTSSVLARRWLSGGLKRDEVVIELRAQIEKALSAGLILTHIDSHKHSHALPAVFDAILDTAGDYGIRAIRLPAGPIQSAGRAVVLNVLSRGYRSRMEKRNFRGTDRLAGITRTGHWTRKWLMNLLSGLPEGATELFCHPGYNDVDLGRIQTRLRASREVELELLTDPEVAAEVARQEIRLINFGSI
jgi:hopanoid biosynthesis associated protein HpnK